MAIKTKRAKALLPSGMRAELFERMSVKTMRYVKSVPGKEAQGLVARVYDMLAEDAFINGSVTSHSKVPELMAGMWTGGRETILVSDQLDRTSKEAMSATLSQVNDCPYCADMLISLVHSNGEHEIASGIFANDEEQITDPVMRERCAWIRAVATAGSEAPPKPPFTAEELPEAIGSLFVFSYINRFSHVVMDGSPVAAPFGLQTVKNAALRMFGFELRPTTARVLVPGVALDLLPPAPLPDDLGWAAPNPRVADALARWAAVIERETPKAVSPQVRELVEGSLQRWQGEFMPLSRSWVDEEVRDLTGKDRSVARLALVVAKASYQFDDSLAEDVPGPDQDEERFIRVLAWASHAGARRVADRYYRYFQA
jgi:AhpD family alkylhydroperoxidase